MLKPIVLAFLGSVFPVILFNIDRKKIWLSGIGGAAGELVAIIALNSSSSTVVSSFAGAFAVGLYSEIMARIKKTPAFEFLIPGIFPLLPGVAGYNTLIYILQKNFSQAIAKGFETIAIGGSMAFGIMLSSAIFRFFSKIGER